MSDIDIDQILRETIPRWNQSDFVFFEPRPWWAPSVQSLLTHPHALPLQRRYGDSAVAADPVTDYRCHSVSSTRDVFDEVLSRPLTGLVLFADGHVRDCLLLLGRLSRLGRPCPPVLAIVPRTAAPLMPLLLESGASTVIIEDMNDRRLADWCRRAARTSDTRHI